MRRNIGRHPDGNAGRAVAEQVGEFCRKNGRLCLRLVVVGDQIDGSLSRSSISAIEAVGQARFGITHRSWRIAVDRTEVSLSIDQACSASPSLGPCGQESDRSPFRRAGGSRLRCRRRSWRIFGVWRRESGSAAASHREYGAERALSRRAHREERAK